MNYQRPSIHRDGRILAVGTDRAVVLWDLARGTELAFLPIGLAWDCKFEPSGDLLTNGSAGVLRWPIHIDPTSGEARIGPPRSLPLPGTSCGIAEDRTGRIVAVANHTEVRVALAERTIRIGPLDDCRYVSLSPDGQWLATGNHQNGGVTIWRLPDGARVTKLPIDGGTGVCFSPDGKWLLTAQGLWEVGSWREVRPLGSSCLSPDGRLGIVQDTSKVPRAGRDRDRPHAGAARKPRPARRGVGHFQLRWLAPGRNDQRTALRARLGLAGHPQATGRDGPQLGCAGLSGRRCGQSGSAAAAPSQGRLWSLDCGPRTSLRASGAPGRTVQRSDQAESQRLRRVPPPSSCLVPVESRTGSHRRPVPGHPPSA